MTVICLQQARFPDGILFGFSVTNKKDDKEKAATKTRTTKRIGFQAKRPGAVRSVLNIENISMR